MHRNLIGMLFLTAAPAVITFGLGRIWIYLSYIPVIVFGLLAFFLLVISFRSGSQSGINSVWQAPLILFLSCLLGAALASRAVF